MHDNVTVAMTACVAPPPGRVYRQEPAVRLDDYLVALRFWLAHPDERIRRIVFADNSGWPLDAVRETADRNPYRRHVEIIQAGSNDIPDGVHYGYGELEILDALVDLGLIGDSTFIKATGRLRFPAISKLLDRLPENLLFAVDCRRRQGVATATTQLFVMRGGFYRDWLYGQKAEIVAGRWAGAEDAVYGVIAPFAGKPGAVLRWPVNCRPSGAAAHWEKSYDGCGQRLHQGVRALARVVTPGWWC